MKKNIIFWTGIINPEHNEKYGGFEWMNYSKLSWQYWCKNNDVIFYEYNKPSELDLMKHRVTWQRWFDVFNFIERDGIDYDKIFMVDASTIIKWNTPNIFDLCDDRLVAWRDFDNLEWVHECVERWRPYFNNFNFDISKYINAGGIILNKNHKEFVDEIKNMYYNDYKNLMNYQHNIVKRGSDQGPLNFLLQIKNINVNLDIPISYQVTHIHKKDLFSYNWQLNEDNTPFLIKYFYVWKFNGFDKNQRTNIMGQIWNLIKDNYVLDYNDLLNSVIHKDTWKNAVSKKFKKDLLDFFRENKYKNMSITEFGCSHGNTTKILSKIFKKVYAIDWKDENINLSKKTCDGCDNIEYIKVDLLYDEWKMPKSDVIFIDFIYQTELIKHCIDKVIKYFGDPIIILSDYGHPNKEIRNAINYKIKEGVLKIDKIIGEYSGYKTSTGVEFIDREGVICNVK